jgi:hypothetical protein
VGKRKEFDAGTYFLWLFGSVSLMNVGYFVYSSISGGGDWGAFVEGLQPALFWRLGMGVAGYLGYVFVVRASARLLAGRVSAQESRRLTRPAYLAGAVVMTVASAFNPQGAQYVLISGLGASLLLTIGLLRVPSLIQGRLTKERRSDECIARSVGWVVAGAMVTGMFVGPGIRFG